MIGCFLTCVRSSPVMLTEGALIERLRRDPSLSLDAHVLHAGFLYEKRRGEGLGALYRQ